MNVLFINPNSGKQVYQALANDYSGVSTPYRSLLLAQATRKSGYEAGILDMLDERLDTDEVTTVCLSQCSKVSLRKVVVLSTE